MGRSYTPRYVLEIPGVTPIAWYVKSVQGGRADGAPTEANLIKWVEAYIESLKPGGSNYHVSKALGYMPIPDWARIRVNCTGGAVVASWKAPMFMAV